VGFETPLALLGLLGVALPIIAHLLRKRDLPAARLPTIAFLERARAQSRRRLRIVDLLLLLVRIALIALLVIGAAAPFRIVELAYGDGRLASVAIVLDDSMSMSQRVDGSTAFQRATERAQEIVDALPRGSEVAIVLAGRHPRVHVPRTEDLRVAAGKLGDLDPPGGRGTDLPAAVGLALRELAGAQQESRRLVILTDGARHGRLDEARIPDVGIETNLETLVEAPRANRTIASAVALPDPSTPDHMSIRFEVRTFGAMHDETLEVRLVREEEAIARTSVTLEDGLGRGTLRAPVVTDGDPSALLELDGRDALSTDDRRAVLLRAPESLRILLVDGDPDPSRDRDEVGFIARAIELAPAAEGAIGYRTIDADAFTGSGLDAYDVVVLANAEAPATETASALREFVALGGGLLTTAGDRVEAAAYHARLSELLPARPRAHVPAAPALRLVMAPESALLPIGRSGLDGVEVSERLLLEPAPLATTELTFDDGSPALVVGSHGSGRVAIFATTIDTDWTDLPYRPGFLPFVVRLLRSLATRSAGPTNPVEPGATVTLSPPPGATRFELVDPAGRAVELSLDEPTPVSQTATPGAYRVRAASTRHPIGEDTRGAFVVWPPVEESDLSAGDADGPDSSAGDVAPSDTASGARVQRPLGPWAFALVGLLAIAEGLLRARRRRYLWHRRGQAA
jgi:hypothetical protein